MVHLRTAMAATRILRAIGWTLSASVALGCSGAAHEASDAGQGADATEPGVDASEASVDATGQDGPRADGASTDGGTQTDSSSTIPWNGGNYYLYGVNYPWLTYGTDFGDGGFGHLANPGQVMADMATFAGVGGHVLRWWIWVDARYDPLFGSNGQVTGFDPLFFSDLDRVRLHGDERVAL
jgi:hypothetical protein